MMKPRFIKCLMFIRCSKSVYMETNFRVGKVITEPTDGPSPYGTRSFVCRHNDDCCGFWISTLWIHERKRQWPIWYMHNVISYKNISLWGLIIYSWHNSHPLILDQNLLQQNVTFWGYSSENQAVHRFFLVINPHHTGHLFTKKTPSYQYKDSHYKP